MIAATKIRSELQAGMPALPGVFFERGNSIQRSAISRIYLKADS